jgi:thymidine kinase
VRKAEFPAHAVSSEKEILRLFRGNVFDVLAVDEAQFFDEWFVGFIEKLLEREAKRDLCIIVCGLDMDAWRKPFGVMPHLLAIANNILKLQAVCFRCRSEHAVFSQKLSGGKNKVDVGDAEKYEARCRLCHTLPEKNKAAK